jgi:hypothetical protein
MEYQNTYQYMKYKIDRSISSRYIKNSSNKPTISSIDHFDFEQKKEILLSFFRELTDETKDKIQDKLLDDPKNLMLRILDISNHSNIEESIVSFLWISVLPKLEDIYDEVEKDMFRSEMSENDENLLLCMKERCSDIRQSIGGNYV